MGTGGKLTFLCINWSLDLFLIDLLLLNSTNYRNSEVLNFNFCEAELHAISIKNVSVGVNATN